MLFQVNTPEWILAAKPAPLEASKYFCLEFNSQVKQVIAAVMEIVHETWLRHDSAQLEPVWAGAFRSDQAYNNIIGVVLYWCNAGGACMSSSGLNALAKCQDAMPSKHTNIPTTTTTTFRPRKRNSATLRVSDHTISAFPCCILLIKRLHCEFE